MKKNAIAHLKQAKTLPEIVAEANEIERMLVESGGELTPEIDAKLQINQETLALKIDKYAFVDESLEAKADYWKRKEQHIAKIRKSVEAAQQSLRERVKQAMLDMGKTEVKGIDARFVLSKCAPRLVIDSEKVPDALKIVVTTTAPDKERIKAALADGLEVPGASLEGGTALRIYENSDE